MRLSCLLPPGIFRAEGGLKASWLTGTKDGALPVNNPGLGWSKGLFPQAQPYVAHGAWGTAEGQPCRQPAHSPPEQAQLLPAASCSSSRSRCSRSSKEISSRARPARQKSRATSLMVLPPRLLWTQGSHSEFPPELNC